MLDKTLLTILHDEDVYIQHAMSFNDDVESIDLRFDAWWKENTTDLKVIYSERLMDDDALVLDTPFPEWCRQMFILWDCNIIKKQQEREQIAWELKLQAELQSLGI